MNFCKAINVGLYEFISVYLAFVISEGFFSVREHTRGIE